MPRCGPTSRQWELFESWAGGPGYPTFLAELRANGGESRVVPKGRAAMRSSSVVVAPGAHGTIGASPRGGLAGVAVPGAVIH